jgi:hypothetical protein
MEATRGVSNHSFWNTVPNMSEAPSDTGPVRDMRSPLISIAGLNSARCLQVEILCHCAPLEAPRVDHICLGTTGELLPDAKASWLMGARNE